ncbi:MAG TPA: hypothetical protein VEQ87_04230 [Burkholderiales bacterium]|nr:hypothetical protein [Burkholderiales bacterium]
MDSNKRHSVFEQGATASPRHAVAMLVKGERECNGDVVRWGFHSVPCCSSFSRVVAVVAAVEMRNPVHSLRKR